MAEDFNKMIEKWEQKQQEQIKQAKAALFLFLAEHHPEIVHIKVVYDGFGDEGNVIDVICYDDPDAHATGIKVEDNKLDQLIEDIFNCVTPIGFETNDGGDGDIHVYPGTQKVIVNHNENIVHQEHETYEA